MGRDHSPQARQKAQLARKKNGSRASYDRILIVSEGTKTEPGYFEEIRRHHRIPTANVVVMPGKDGTAPTQVVQYAERLFVNGDAQCGIEKGAFEQVYAVFDRDQHSSYHAAIAQARKLDGKLKNDLGKRVDFCAIPSIPCFELWLLLHFENVQAPLTAREALHRLQRHLPGYDKGHQGTYEKTRAFLEQATERAQALSRGADGKELDEGDGPFTAVSKLVKLLTTLPLTR